jgi:hypothetical protein
LLACFLAYALLLGCPPLHSCIPLILIPEFISGLILDLRGRKWQEAGEDKHNEELNNLYIIKYYLGDEIKEDEMNGSCSMHRGNEKCI